MIIHGIAYFQEHAFLLEISGHSSYTVYRRPLFRRKDMGKVKQERFLQQLGKGFSGHIPDGSSPSGRRYSPFSVQSTPRPASNHWRLQHANSQLLLLSKKIQRRKALHRCGVTRDELLSFLQQNTIEISSGVYTHTFTSFVFRMTECAVPSF